MYTENTSSVLPKLLSDLTALWGTAIYITSGFAPFKGGWENMSIDKDST